MSIAHNSSGSHRSDTGHKEAPEAKEEGAQPAPCVLGKDFGSSHSKAKGPVSRGRGQLPEPLGHCFSTVRSGVGDFCILGQDKLKRQGRKSAEKTDFSLGLRRGQHHLWPAAMGVPLPASISRHQGLSEFDVC